MAMRIPQKYLGSTGWASMVEVDEVSIDRAILRTRDEIVVDCVVEGQRYTITLKRVAGDEFHGTYIAQRGGKKYEDAVNCRLVCSESSAVLVGHWTEEGSRYLWWAELDPVEHFPGEEKESARGLKPR